MGAKGSVGKAHGLPLKACENGTMAAAGRHSMGSMGNITLTLPE
jgi:hypothetical protein